MVCQRTMTAWMTATYVQLAGTWRKVRRGATLETYALRARWDIMQKQSNRLHVSAAKLGGLQKGMEKIDALIVPEDEHVTSWLVILRELHGRQILLHRGCIGVPNLSDGILLAFH